MTTTSLSRRDRHEWVNDFNRAFSEARLADAARLYDEFATGDEEYELALPGAKAHLRSDPAAALRMLIGLRVPRSKPRECIEREILLAEAFALTSDFESADARLEAALSIAHKLGDGDLIAAVGYRYVRRYLFQNDVTSARQMLDLARQGESQLACIYALCAECLVLSYEERVREAASRMVELLGMCDPQSNEYPEVRAWATHALAALSRELFIPDAIAEIERQLSGSWSPDFATNKFQILKALGWAKAIQGDLFNGFRHLKQASEVAHSPAWKVVAACDRAYLARCQGEHRWSRQELDEAEQIANDLNWYAILDEERIGLLLLAELFSEVDLARSAMYLARYRELGEFRSPKHNRKDARVTAFAQYSTAVVELALGNRKRGLAELRQARQTFDRFGYDFRSARCLITEYSVTRAPELLASAAEKLGNYEKSWLAEELSTMSGNRSEIMLPPMQKKVFEEMCQGKTTAQIAQSLNRSEFTVSNHIKQIFKAFSVSNRSSLLAEAARRNMLRP